MARMQNLKVKKHAEERHKHVLHGFKRLFFGVSVGRPFGNPGIKHHAVSGIVAACAGNGCEQLFRSHNAVVFHQKRIVRCNRSKKWSYCSMQKCQQNWCGWRKGNHSRYYGWWARNRRKNSYGWFSKQPCKTGLSVKIDLWDCYARSWIDKL